MQRGQTNARTLSQPLFYFYRDNGLQGHNTSFTPMYQGEFGTFLIIKFQCPTKYFIRLPVPARRLCKNLFFPAGYLYLCHSQQFCSLVLGFPLKVTADNQTSVFGGKASHHFPKRQQIGNPFFLGFHRDIDLAALSILLVAAGSATWPGLLRR